MSSIPSPILIFGDKFLSRNNIISIKNKYPQFEFITMSATSDSMDEIRAEVGTGSWVKEQKIVVIEDIPNKKEIRDFIIDISKNKTDNVGVIIVDTKNHIKVDPKTQTFLATWATFIKSFKKIEGSKVVNNGDTYNDKSKESCAEFVEKSFLRNGVQIKHNEIELVLSIVGYDRGLLLSDIDKMSLTAPSPITSEFIIENAFPGSTEAIIYKFSNALDSGSYTESINSADEFVNIHKINENVLADILLKKARWQLAATYYYSKGMAWDEITNRIMSMGKFPSHVWHHPKLDLKQKSELSSQYSEKNVDFLIKKQGIPYFCFKNVIDTEKDNQEVEGSESENKRVKKKKSGKSNAKEKKPKAETIPMQFMASQVTNFVRDKIINPRVGDEQLKVKALNRATMVYLFLFKKLVEIRKGKNTMQHLRDAIRMFVNLNPDSFQKEKG